MASRLNSTLAGKWEDVQAYTSVTIILKNGNSLAGDLHLQWVNMPGKTVPNDSTTYSFEDIVPYAPSQTSTYQFKTKARWFRLHVNPAGTTSDVSVTTTYKKAPTEIQLGDRQSNMLSINPASLGNSLYTVLADQSGSLLGTTNATGEAMYTHLTASGSSLATTFDGIMRSSTDVSFILTTGDEGYGTILPESNCFRLPRSKVKFRDGDEIIMGMGLLDDTDFGITPINGGPTIVEAISGTMVIGIVRYIKVEDDYIQFQIQVNQNTSDWFDPDIGNPDVAQGDNNEVTGTTPSGKQYLKQVRNDGTLNTVDQYYEQFAGIIVDNNPYSYFQYVQSPTSSTYPFDVRLYRGSLAHKYYALDISHTVFNTSAFPSGPNQLANGIINGSPSVDVSLMYDIVDTETPGYTLFAYSYPDTSLYIGNIRWTSPDLKIKDYFGRWIDATTVDAARPFQVRVVEDFDNLHILSINNFDGGAGRPVDTLGVAIRDGQNMDIDTTKGVDTYYFDPDRPTGSRVLFLVDSSFADTGDNTVSAYRGFQEVMYDVAEGANVNNAGFWVIMYDRTAGQSDGNFDQQPLRTGVYNLWNALTYDKNSYLNLDTIVAFHYGTDMSATFQERMLFDACASYFDGINRIVVTSSDRDSTDLLPFTGSTNNILIYDKIVNDVIWNEVTTPTLNGEISSDGNTFTITSPNNETDERNGWSYIYAHFETAGSFTYTCAFTINGLLTTTFAFEYVTTEEPSDGSDVNFNDVTVIALASGNDTTNITRTVTYNAGQYVALGVISNSVGGPGIGIFYGLPLTYLAFETDTSFQTTLAKRIAGQRQTGHNALYVVNTDISGHPQAGTNIITSDQGDGVSLYYSLADNSGLSISTTNVNGSNPNNALYVTFANGNNPLNVAVQETTKPGLMFHYSISGYPVSSPLLGNNSLRITHLGAANETAIPLWLKVYDMSSGYFIANSGAAPGIDASAFALKNKLIYNLAVPPMDYRDIEFPKGLTINDGLYLATSTTHTYDSYGTIGAARMYVQGQFF